MNKNWFKCCIYGRSGRDVVALVFYSHLIRPHQLAASKLDGCLNVKPHRKICLMQEMMLLAVLFLPVTEPETSHFF